MVTGGLIEIEFIIDFLIVFGRKGYIYAFNAYYGPILGGISSFFIRFFYRIFYKKFYIENSPFSINGGKGVKIQLELNFNSSHAERPARTDEISRVMG